ncbi:hypothetical protein [uncultured Gammaproteobacteria bacterium]|nr:hypothetical protein [uncultured Gammaproteobacteria bacterium]
MMCWLIKSIIKCPNKVSVAGCLGYDVLEEVGIYISIIH